MGELTITSFVTLDGIMQAPGAPQEDMSGGFQWGGWLVPHADADMGAIITEIFDRAGAFLLGHGTYDIFAGHWPKMTDSEDPVASKLNALPKYVVARIRKPLEWNNSHYVDDVVQEVAALKACTEGELQTHGSPGLAQTLIQHDLIDEYRILTFPVVIGKGKRLFGEGAIPTNLTLVSTKPTSKGMIYSVYRRGDGFKAGSFAL